MTAMLAAFAVTAITDGRSGVKGLVARMLRWRVRPRWWLFAVGSPLFCCWRWVCWSWPSARPARARRFRPDGRAAGLGIVVRLGDVPLFFLLQSYRDLGPIGVPGFLIGLACGSIVLAWLYESAAGSVLIVAVWHGTYNLTAATAGAHGTVAAMVSTGVKVVAALIAWRHRRRVPRIDPMSLPAA